jgi:hypothetical protein
MPLSGSKGTGGTACPHARDLLPTAVGPPRPISQPTRDPGRHHQHLGLRRTHQHRLPQKPKTRHAARRMHLPGRHPGPACPHRRFFTTDCKMPFVAIHIPETRYYHILIISLSGSGRRPWHRRPTQFSPSGNRPKWDRFRWRKRTCQANPGWTPSHLRFARPSAHRACRGLRPDRRRGHRPDRRPGADPTPP